MFLKKRTAYWSISQLKQFLYCPVSFYRLYYEGLPRPPSNIYMAYGSAIHKALQINYEQKIKTRKDLEFEEVFRAFHESFSQEISKNNLNYEEGLVTQAGKSLEYYLQFVSPNIQPLFVESKFELPLKNFPITILGYIDLIDEQGRIIDHKSGGKTWRSTWKQSTVDEDIQLTLYAAAYRKIFNKKEGGLSIDIVARNASILYHRIDTDRTQEQILQLLNLITKAEETCKQGMFDVNLKNCKRCPFNSVCPKLPILNE